MEKEKTGQENAKKVLLLEDTLMFPATSIVSQMPEKWGAFEAEIRKGLRKELISLGYEGKSLDSKVEEAVYSFSRLNPKVVSSFTTAIQNPEGYDSRSEEFLRLNGENFKDSLLGRHSEILTEKVPLLSTLSLLPYRGGEFPLGLMSKLISEGCDLNEESFYGFGRHFFGFVCPSVINEKDTLLKIRDMESTAINSYLSSRKVNANVEVALDVETALNELDAHNYSLVVSDIQAPLKIGSIDYLFNEVLQEKSIPHTLESKYRSLGLEDDRMRSGGNVLISEARNKGIPCHIYTNCSHADDSINPTYKIGNITREEYDGLGDLTHIREADSGRVHVGHKRYEGDFAKVIAKALKSEYP